MSFPGKHTPPPTPRLTSEVNRPRARPRGDPTRPPLVTPWPKIESRRVTLECQTLKVREPRSVEVSSLASHSFVISLLGNQWVPSLGLRHYSLGLRSKSPKIPPASRSPASLGKICEG